MTSNSQIFTSSVFGKSSGKTAAELTEINTSTQEQYFQQFTGTSLKTKLPRVPSNQGIAKGK
jgi:hypothetical protein